MRSNKSPHTKEMTKSTFNLDKHSNSIFMSSKEGNCASHSIFNNTAFVYHDNLHSTTTRQEILPLLDEFYKKWILSCQVRTVNMCCGIRSVSAGAGAFVLAKEVSTSAVACIGLH